MTAAPLAVPLDPRAVVEVAGPDAATFLNGITSNDVARVDAETAVWTAFLTAQGKFLHEFHVVHGGPERLWLDVEAGRRDPLVKRLSLYKLRSRVSLTPRDDLAAVALLGERALGLLDLPALEGYARPLGGGVAFTEPRLARLGGRAILPRDGLPDTLTELGFALGSLADYDRLRLSLGIPDGSRDLDVEKATLIESGFDELHGISWEKGCFLGQELTARMKYRGLAKKRLVPVRLDGPTPPPGTELRRNGKSAGTLRSAVDGLGLALLRLDQLDAEATRAGFAAEEARAYPEKPDWAAF